MAKGLLAGKNGVVMGVANSRSLAWAVAVEASRQGAEIAVTYQNERLERRVRELEEHIPLRAAVPCDVGQGDETVERALERIVEVLGPIDFLVHSIAFANKEDLDGSFVDTGRDGFAVAHDISVYSFVAAARAAASRMRETGGSLQTITFEGSRRVFPHYNVMGVAKAALESSVRYLAYDLGARGIRVNAVSAGPVKTLAASAVRGLSKMRETMAERTPLRRNIDAEEVAGAVIFLASDLARGITGEVIHVDAGYHIMGC